MKITAKKWIIKGITLLIASISFNSAYATSNITDCYEAEGLTPPKTSADKILYVFIDQTTLLPDNMKSKLMTLVTDWDKPGDRVKIARFSAQTKGQYNELMFDEMVLPFPDQEYLYNMKRSKKKPLLACLNQRRQEYSKSLDNAMTSTLALIGKTLPKSEIFYSLRELSKSLITESDVADKTILFVSDGLENSSFTSFYARKGIKLISTNETMGIINKNSLQADWDNAKVYILGLGYFPDSKLYIRPNYIERLKGFWMSYFTAGSGEIVAVGTPMLLTNSIRN